MRTVLLAAPLFAYLLLPIDVLHSEPAGDTAEKPKEQSTGESAVDSGDKAITIEFLNGRRETIVPPFHTTSLSIIVGEGPASYTIWAKDLSDETLKRFGMTQELAKRAEERRKTEFEISQRGKGLVKHGERWVTPAEKEALEKTEAKKREAERRESEYVRRANEVVNAKSPGKVAFEVFQPLEAGSLCISLNSQREIFLWLDFSKRVAATDERYSSRLYWAGTFSYTTAAGRERTVNVYTMDLQKAISAVRVNFGMFDKTEEPSPPRIAEQGGPEPVVPKGSGSGFIVTEDGYVVTCQHVISKSRRLRVKTSEGLADAKLIAQDAENDLALLKIEGTYKPVSFSAASSAKLGQTIFTLGFPMPDLQGFEPKVTKGVISSLSGISDDIRHYQIDAAIQPGNSGGPLADEAGNIVGILEATLNPGYVIQERGSLPQNVNYALRKSYLMAFLEARREVAGRLNIAAEGVKPAFEDAVEKMRKSVVLIVAY